MSESQGPDTGREVFLEEAAELLEQLEESLLELEESPDDIELVGSVFRALHTIKGSGAMFGFDRVSSFTHEVETVFDEVRSGSMQASRELIDLTLASRDVIRGMLDDEIGDDASNEEAQRIVMGLKALSGTETGSDPSASTGDEQEKSDQNEEREGLQTTWRIRFKPPEDIFTTGTNPVHLLEDLRELGDCDIVALNDEIPRLAKLDPEQFHVGWDILLTTDKGEDAILDVFIFVGDDSDLKIEVVEHHDVSDDEDNREKILRLGDILVMRGELTREQLEDTMSNKTRIGDLLVDKGLLSKSKLNVALQEQEHLKKNQIQGANPTEKRE